MQPWMGFLAIKTIGTWTTNFAIYFEPNAQISAKGIYVFMKGQLYGSIHVTHSSFNSRQPSNKVVCTYVQ